MVRIPWITVTEYTIRRSDRARRLRIVVAPEGVEVVLPRRMALRHAEEFVAEKRPWIERTLRQYRAAEASLPPVGLEDGGEIPYVGLTLPVRVHVEPCVGSAANGRPRPAPVARIRAGRRRGIVVRARPRPRGLALLLLGPIPGRRRGERVHRAHGGGPRDRRPPRVRGRRRAGPDA